MKRFITVVTQEGFSSYNESHCMTMKKALLETMEHCKLGDRYLTIMDMPEDLVPQDNGALHVEIGPMTFVVIEI